MLVKETQKKRNIKNTLRIQAIQTSFRQRGKKKGRVGGKEERKEREDRKKERRKGGGDREGLATQLQN